MTRGSMSGATTIFLLALIAYSAHPLQAQSPIPPPEATYLAFWPVTLKPNDIAANPEDGTLAVVDAGHSRIQILRRGGGHKTFRKGFQDPRCAAFLPGGILLVGEAGHGSVKGYDENGGVVLTLGSPTGEFLTPNDIAVHPTTGRIYVVDSASDTVKAYRQSDGLFEFQFGVTGTGPGQLRFPISVAVSPELGEVFVGDSRNRRIAIFDAETGAFRRNIGTAGGDDGEISFVGGLHVDAVGRLYVVEALGGFVQIFDPDGGLVGRIGEHGQRPGQLRSPKAAVIDQYNRLLVTSFMDDKIEVWGLDSFRNPTDQGIIAVSKPVPRYLNRKNQEKRLRVIVHIEGIGAGELDPVQFRINGSARADRDTYRMGPKLAVHFRVSEVLATLPPGFTGERVLKLSGMTRQGQRFQSDIPVEVIDDAPPPSHARSGAKRGANP